MCIRDRFSTVPLKNWMNSEDGKQMTSAPHSHANEQERKLGIMFEMCDRDGDGFVDFEDISSFLGESGFSQMDNRLLEIIDAHCDSKRRLNFDSFVDCMIELQKEPISYSAGIENTKEDPEYQLRKLELKNEALIQKLKLMESQLKESEQKNNELEENLRQLQDEQKKEKKVATQWKMKSQEVEITLESVKSELKKAHEASEKLQKSNNRLSWNNTQFKEQMTSLKEQLGRAQIQEKMSEKASKANNIEQLESEFRSLMQDNEELTAELSRYQLKVMRAEALSSENKTLRENHERDKKMLQKSLEKIKELEENLETYSLQSFRREVIHGSLMNEIQARSQVDKKPETIDKKPEPKVEQKIQTKTIETKVEKKPEIETKQNIIQQKSNEEQKPIVEKKIQQPQQQQKNNQPEKKIMEEKKEEKSMTIQDMFKAALSSANTPSRYTSFPSSSPSTSLPKFNASSYSSSPISSTPSSPSYRSPVQTKHTTQSPPMGYGSPKPTTPQSMEKNKRLEQSLEDLAAMAKRKYTL
eukprot:TRINITY_DN2402_c0_g1_i2.p1 TRINITY_DN2402_c0_g1~~TRINITY_DN2402_c0_g1_i2.p1  ORF type:complete len:528 (+),score=168.71 TRINITY_DN2402_c0_g1_i2:55-1638(+)